MLTIRWRVSVAKMHILFVQNNPKVKEQGETKMVELDLEIAQLDLKIGDKNGVKNCRRTKPYKISKLSNVVTRLFIKTFISIL